MRRCHSGPQSGNPSFGGGGDQGGFIFSLVYPLPWHISPCKLPLCMSQITEQDIPNFYDFSVNYQNNRASYFLENMCVYAHCYVKIFLGRLHFPHMWTVELNWRNRSLCDPRVRVIWTNFTLGWHSSQLDQLLSLSNQLKLCSYMSSPMIGL